MNEGMPELLEESSLDTASVHYEQAEVLHILERLEAMDAELDPTLNERFGEGFSEQLKGRMEEWWGGLITKGDGFLNWAEEKGMPLPKTKVGMRVTAGITGAAGAIVPGLGVFLPVAYLLWKRSGDIERPTKHYPTASETPYA